MSNGDNQKNPAILPPEDSIGLAVADVLQAQFDVTRRLVERCETLASARRGDRVAPITAAARLLRASGQLALGLARVARIETRHRSIIERPQPLKPSEPELNSEKNQYPEGRTALQELEHRLERLVGFQEHDAQVNYVAGALGIDEDEASQIVPGPYARSDDDEEDD
jgi:hypothetical protein